MTLNQLKMHNIAPRGIAATCVPTSICFATGASYYDVEEILLREQPGVYRPDHKTNQGVFVNRLLGSARLMLGHKFIRYPFPRVHLRSFLNMIGMGTYLVNIPRHMFVVKDCEVFDLNNVNLNSLCLEVWKVEKA